MKEPQNEEPIAMNIFVGLKEQHNAGELAVDRLAIVFIPLQENQFFSWRTSG